MNQTTLNVRLFEDEETKDDILSFQFEDGNGDIELNSDSNQNQIKQVFTKLIKLSLASDIVLKLVIDEKYRRGLYKDVCTEYIKELQKEINDSRERIRRELSE